MAAGRCDTAVVVANAGQMLALWHACRAAKEKLFENPKLKTQPVTVLGRGRKVVGGTVRAELTRETVEQHDHTTSA